MSSAPTLGRKLLAELIGTYIFVVVGAGSAVGVASLPGPNSGSALLIGALGNGLGLAMAVSATMGISGGVLNPAVALALVINRKLSYSELIPYVIAELAGATGAGLSLVLFFPAALGTGVHWGSPTLNDLVGPGQGIAIEALLTFVLVMAVFGTAIDRRAPKIGGFGIGLAVIVDVLAGGGLTGAAMNPARALGPMIAGSFFPSYWYVYIVGPLIGALAGGLVYMFLIEESAKGVGDK